METAVFYLIWSPMGARAVDRFRQSYDQHFVSFPSYELFYILNGYTGQKELGERVIQSGLPVIQCPTAMLDMAAYHYAATQVPHKYVCFLGSYSRILHDDWTNNLVAAIKTPGVGIAGCTGSYESHYTRCAAAAQKGGGYWDLEKVYKKYPPHPNPHIRTTGFIMEREKFLEYDCSRAVAKSVAFDIESGYTSLTNWLRCQGLRTVVVGVDGMYDIDDWERSRTFRSGDQENLLVADNHTDIYDRASDPEREDLRAIAWDGNKLLASVRERTMVPAASLVMEGMA
jgi:hypothetical protein